MRGGSASGDPPAEGTPFAGYFLLKRIAVGGTSEVFVARPKEGDSPAPRVAVKRLLPDLAFDSATRRTFATEAKIHSVAKHRNIVEIYEAGEYEGEAYIAMEYVSGVDLFRLLRFAEPPLSTRTSGDKIARAGASRTLGVSLAVHIARELCEALSCVHRLTDASGAPLGVVHRDVTPSNIYLSERGDVKLGDFGIARASAVRRPQPSVALKGKYAYLAPEQVSAEPFDHRADLFSLTVVLAEMILGAPLFAGAGQLAVLLAIRDVRIDALRAIQSALPPGLFEVLEKALAKFPEDRFASAKELSHALEPFETADRDALRRELASWVRSAREVSGIGRQIDRAIAGVSERESSPESERSSAVPASTPEPPSQRPTLQPGAVLHCRIRRKGGEAKPVQFAKLVELLATGQVGADDQVDIGNGFHRACEVPQLARYLPPSTGTTARVEGPGVPDFTVRLPVQTVVDAMSWLVEHLETGLLIADSAQSRCELYFDRGKLVLAASSEASTLLGEHLVARGAIDRGELEMALVVMHKYDNHLGDTLIGLGLVDPVDVFQCIRAQGRARVAGLFTWRSGVLNFYRGVRPTRIDFSLDLDVPALVLSGLRESRSDEALLAEWFPRRAELFAPESPPHWAKSFTWPALFLTVFKSLGKGRSVGSMLDAAAGPAAPTSPSRPELLRALEAAIALRVVSPVTVPSGGSTP